MYATLALIAAMAAMGAMIIPAEATSTCITTDSTLLGTMEAKITRHGNDTGRTDLHEMFTKSYNTMKGTDTYTTSDIKARSDKQGSNWQGPGPNELWRTIYAELDRLETCRANLQTDTTPPVITMSGSATVTINKGNTYTDAGATCVDNTDGVISPVSTGTVDTTTSGSYTISYSCTDTAGNTATQLTRTVTVQNPSDTTPPLIIMNGNATVAIQKGDSYTDAGATCVDDTDGVISPVSTGTVDTTTSGSYTISYSCTDTAGNTATQLTRTVTVQNTPISQDTQPAAPKPGTQTPSDNLISNGSFEAPAVSSWGHITSGTAGLEWSVSGGPMEIQRGILGGASDGSQHIELDSTGSVTISQTISTTSGQSYTVSFDYKARPDTAASTNGIRVQWNGADIASGITFGDTWKTHTVTVTGTGSDTISFIDAGTSDGLGTFLDNISVVATPLYTAQSIPQRSEQDDTGNPSIHVSGPSVIYIGSIARFNVTYHNLPPLDSLDVEWREPGSLNWSAVPHLGGNSQMGDHFTLSGLSTTGASNSIGYGDPGTYELRVRYGNASHTQTIKLVEPPNTISESGARNAQHMEFLRVNASYWVYKAPGATTIPHLESLSGDGIRFNLGGPHGDVYRIDWRVDGKTYKTAERESEVTSNGRVDLGIETHFKIGGQDEGSGGSVQRDTPNTFGMGTHSVTAEVTYKDGSRLILGSPGHPNSFIVTARDAGNFMLTAMHLSADQYTLDDGKSFKSRPDRLEFSTNATASGGNGNYLIWYVNGEKHSGPCTGCSFLTINNPKPGTYTVYADVTYGGKDGSKYKLGTTPTKTITINPPPPPMPSHLQITKSVTMYGDTAEIDYGYLGKSDFSLAWKTSQWQIKSGYVQIAERDGSNPINLGGSSAGWIGECEEPYRNPGQLTIRYRYVACDLDNPSHRSETRYNGYAFSTHHSYVISDSKVTAINALDDPYIFIRTDSDSTFKPVVKLSKPRG